MIPNIVVTVIFDNLFASLVAIDVLIFVFCSNFAASSPLFPTPCLWIKLGISSSYY